MRLTLAAATAVLATTLVIGSQPASAQRAHMGGHGGMHMGSHIGGSHMGARSGGFRGGFRSGNFGHRHYGYWGGHRGYWRGAGVGLATGALIGGALAAQPYYWGYYDEPDTYAEPAPAAGDDVQYCMSRFKSYDPSSGTYMGYDGIRHPCP